MMKYFLLTLSLGLAVVIPCQAGLFSHGCPHCGCSQVKKVCRIVPDVKKITETKYVVECEEVCLPGKSRHEERLVTDSLNIEVDLVLFDVILSLRDEYRRAMNCQIVHDSQHARGFTDSYLLQMQGQIIGYGSVTGDARGSREIIKEFYVLPAYRAVALPLFRRLIEVSKARWMAS